MFTRSAKGPAELITPVYFALAEVYFSQPFTLAEPAADTCIRRKSCTTEIV